MTRIVKEAEITRIKTQIDLHKKAIGKSRDALRDLQEDLEGVIGSAEEAIEHLEMATDSLSELL